jgi:hypothetical protein
MPIRSATSRSYRCPRWGRWGLGTDPADEAFFYTARVLTGNLTLISGMVAANEPWRLSLRLSRALTGAVAAGVFGLVTADIWRPC